MQTTITIDPRSIIYRIGSTLYVEAQAMPPDTPPALRALLQDATNTDNLPLLNIHLGDAIARLQELLLAYIPVADAGAGLRVSSPPGLGTMEGAVADGVTEGMLTPRAPALGTVGLGAVGDDTVEQPQQAAPRPPRLDPVTIQVDIPGAAPTTVATLQRLAVEYVTNYALACWLAITCPAKFDYYNQQALQNQLDMTATLTHRTQPVRRRMHPF